MKILHRDTPRLSGFSAKGKSLTSPLTTLWIGIVFVVILLAIFGAKRNLTDVEDRQEKRTLYSGYLSDPPEKKELGDPPPNPDLLLDRPSELLITKNEVIELHQKVEPIEIEMIDLELDVRLSERPNPVLP